MTSPLNTKVTKSVSLISILTVLRTGPNDLRTLRTVSRLCGFPANVYLYVLPGDKAAEACSCPTTQKHLKPNWRIYLTSCRPLILLDGAHGVVFNSAYGQIYVLNYSWSFNPGFSNALNSSISKVTLKQSNKIWFRILTFKTDKPLFQCASFLCPELSRLW